MIHTFLVESYWAELSDVSVRARAARIAAAAQSLRADGRPVTFLGSLLIPDDEVCFWRFAGTSLTDVEEAVRRAGLEIARIARSVDIACAAEQAIVNTSVGTNPNSTTTKARP